MYMLILYLREKISSLKQTSYYSWTQYKHTNFMFITKTGEKFEQ